MPGEPDTSLAKDLHIRCSDENEKPTSAQTLTADKPVLSGTTVLNLPSSEDDVTADSIESESLDDLLAELESDDEGEDLVEEAVAAIGTPRKIPDEYLHTDPAIGLNESDVNRRRRIYGPNQMKEEKYSHIKQFVLFFVGPIQFVMEASSPPFL